MSDRLFYLAAAPFEAARYVDILPDAHRARKLHGHSFVARVRSELPVSKATFEGSEVDDLQSHLASAVGPLDYSLLNDHLSVPTDENLARWIDGRLEPATEYTGVLSTRDQGVDLDANGNAHIWRRFRFEAAHQLNNVPEGHQCGRMHGHGFEVILHVEQNIQGSDLGIDFDYLECIWQPLHKQLHYNCLNDIPGLEIPTSEMLASWVWNKLKPELPQLSWVSTYETATSGCHFNGSEHRIWKEQRFEAATQLRAAPAGDPRGRLHGHSYISRLHLTAPIDEVMGWTVDYGDVKEVFKPIYKQLDHHNLATITGPESSSLASLAHWVKSRLSNTLSQLDRLDLYQTPGCGCALNWGKHSPALPV